jgi:hypothetical protein
VSASIASRTAICAEPPVPESPTTQRRNGSVEPRGGDVSNQSVAAPVVVGEHDARATA